MEPFTLANYKPFCSMSEIMGKRFGILYREFVPSEYLQPYILCYWTMASESELTETILHRVIPDGCVNIVFDLKADTYKEVAWVTGAVIKPIFPELKGLVDYIGVAFLPSGFLHFFDYAVCDFTNQSISLEVLSTKEERNLSEQLFLATHIENKVKLLEQYFGKRLRVNRKTDSVVRNALCSIFRKEGNVKIVELSKTVNSSQRQLRRKFDHWIGVSPKTFCRIIRFQSILQILRRDPSRDILSVALDAGFFDQSHFIHEFNSYYGLTPLEFLRSKNF